MKRAHAIIVAALIFFIVGACVLWRVASSVAHAKTVETLHGARATFGVVSENVVEGVLWYSSKLVFDDVGRTARPIPFARMCELAREHHLDEIDIISPEGVIIASNVKKCLGFEIGKTDEGREVMGLLSPTSERLCVKHTFRPSLENPSKVCKFFSVVFPDRSGILEVGFTREHVIRSVGMVGDIDYRKWKIGQYGYFEVVDEDGDGWVDGSRPDFPEEGVLGEGRTVDGQEAMTLTFSHAGMLYRAVVPRREYYDQRDKVVTFAYAVAGVFFLLLAVAMFRTARANDRLDALHRHLEERTAHDLAMARVIQLSSLQRAELFRIEDLDSTFAAVTYPARDVGGDLYGLFQLANGRIAFVVGDVSGKGVPAAMFMHVAKNTFELQTRLHDDLSEAVALSNEGLCEHNQAEMFVTAWFGVLDPATGIVEYVNAGHNRPYVLRANGSVERVDGKGGFFLGMFPHAKYRLKRLKLYRGDRLFVFSDGVTEAMDGAKRVYGEARLVSLLKRRPDDLCAAVRRDVEAFAKGVERSDDMTMLELWYHGRPERVEQLFPADPDSQAGMVEFVRGVMRFVNRKQGAKLLNAIDEVLSNVVNYSGSPTVSIVVENVPGRCRITISDSGAAYSPLQHQDPDVHVALEDRPIGGLGILMVKKLVNSLKYRRVAGKNVLTIVQLDFDGAFRQIV